MLRGIDCSVVLIKAASIPRDTVLGDLCPYIPNIADCGVSVEADMSFQVLALVYLLLVLASHFFVAYSSVSVSYLDIVVMSRCQCRANVVRKLQMAAEDALCRLDIDIVAACVPRSIYTKLCSRFLLVVAAIYCTETIRWGLYLPAISFLYGAMCILREVRFKNLHAKLSMITWYPVLIAAVKCI